MGLSYQNSLDTMLQVVEKTNPGLLKLAMPRRYNVPTGFLNPKYNSAIMCSFFMEPSLSFRLLTDQTILVDKVLSYHLLERMVPTYFVAEPFLRAVLATEPPKDFQLIDLFWPMEAMVLALPVKFMQEYTGYNIPFLSIAKAQKGDHTCKFLDYADVVELTMPKILFGWNVFLTDTHFDYAGAFPLDFKVGEVVETEAFTDYTADYKTEILDQIAPNRQPGLTQEQDVALSRKIYALGIKLLLAMTARPHMVEQGVCIRRAKIKHGRLRDELWSPNTIGDKYKIIHAKSEHQGGTHASPRLHWRLGHYRYQPYGPGRQSRKLIPIDPVLVGAAGG